MKFALLSALVITVMLKPSFCLLLSTRSRAIGSSRPLLSNRTTMSCRISEVDALISKPPQEEHFDHITCKELKIKILALGGKPSGLNKCGLVALYNKLSTNPSTSEDGGHSKFLDTVSIPKFTPKSASSFSSGVLHRSKELLLPNQMNMVRRTTSSTQARKQMITAALDDGSTINKSEDSRKTRFPIGSQRELRFTEQSATGDMELSFLGTASCVPTVTRGVSCIVLRYQGEAWMFDCGEATQVRLQASHLKASRFRKIFITHLHGDHLFGLPGILCLLGKSTLEERGLKSEDGAILPPIDIYGPEGIRDYIRVSMQTTYSRITIPYRVHELKAVPFLHGRVVRPPQVVPLRTRYEASYGERSGGKDIYPDRNGIYNVVTASSGAELLSVQAAPLQHTIPCLGYVVTEKDRIGALRPELIEEVVDRNQVALSTLPEFRNHHRKVYGYLKTLPPDASYTFPDGTIVKSEAINSPPKKGRKVVILGDTCNSDYIQHISNQADVLIHEATNCYEEANKYEHYYQLERETFNHGHSTPEMAGKFAKLIEAKKLVLTHFSPRYQGDSSEQSMRAMWKIEDMARKVSHLKGENDVIAAWDFMSIAVK
jgi:ribonuclease Z